jgi:uncharacterized membrane protein
MVRYVKSRLLLALLLFISLFSTAIVTLGNVEVPNNDLPANAYDLAGYPQNSLSDSNDNATSTDHGGTASVWFKWTASGNGALTINTNGSSFDTALKLFLSTNLTTPLQSDTDGGEGTNSAISAGVVAGSTYYIAVSSQYATTGYYNLQWLFTADPGGGTPTSPQVIFLQPINGTTFIPTYGSTNRLSVYGYSYGVPVTTAIKSVTFTLYSISNSQYWTGSEWGALTNVPCAINEGSYNAQRGGRNTDWSSRWDLPVLSSMDGEYRVSATVTDANNTTTTATNKFFVQAPAAPEPTETPIPAMEVSITTPINNATSSTFPQIKGIITNPIGTISIVEIFVKDAAGLNSWNGVEWKSGSHSIEVPCVDNKFELPSTFTSPPRITGTVVQYRALARARIESSQVAVSSSWTKFNVNYSNTLKITTPIHNSTPTAAAFLKIAGSDSTSIGNWTNVDIFIKKQGSEAASTSGLGLWWKDNAWRDNASASTTLSVANNAFEWLDRPERSLPKPPIGMTETYEIQAKAFDGGGFKVSTIVFVKVSTPIPPFTIALTYPANNAVLSSPLTSVEGGVTGASENLAPIQIRIKNVDVPNTWWNGSVWVNTSTPPSITVEAEGSGEGSRNFVKATQLPPAPAANTTETYDISAIGQDGTRSATVTRRIKVSTVPIPYKPDLWIRQASASPQGRDIFSPEKQQVTVSATAGGSITYWVTVQNDCATADSIILKAKRNTASSVSIPDSNVTFSIMNGSTVVDVTAAVKGLGYETALLNKDAFTQIYMKVDIPVGASNGAMCLYDMTGSSKGAATYAAVPEDIVTTKTFIGKGQPDLMVRSGSETIAQASRNDLYLDDDPSKLADQMRVGTTVLGRDLTYRVSIQNDGDVSDTYILSQVDNSPSQPGFVINYYDSAAPTSALALPHTTPSITPGSSREILIVVTPTASNNDLDGKTKQITLVATSQVENAKSDRVAVRTTAFMPQPDLLIKRDSDKFETAREDNVYTSASQTLTAGIAPGKSIVYLVRLQNDGAAEDQFLMREDIVTDNPNVKATYTTASGTPISTLLRQPGGYQTVPIAPGNWVEYLMTVSATAGAPVNDFAVITLWATSEKKGSKSDRISTRTAVSAPRPDTWIRLESETQNLGDDVYHGVGGAVIATQQRNGEGLIGDIVRYIVTVQNDGTHTDAFRLLGVMRAGDSSDFNIDSVKYYYQETAEDPKVDITAEVNAGTYVTPYIARGGKREYQMEVSIPGAAVGAFKHYGLYAYSVGDGVTYDRSSSQTYVRQLIAKPDTWIRLENAADNLGNNIYHGFGGAVISSQQLNGAGIPGQIVKYIVTVQNDGNYKDSFKLSGVMRTEDSPLFTNANVKYFDKATGQDISVTVKDGTYKTPVLPVGATKEYGMEITIPSNASVGAFKHYGLYAYSEGETLKFDRSSSQTYVQNISKLQYSIDGRVNWFDVPLSSPGYPLTIHQSMSVDFRAIPGTNLVGWPYNKPLWDGDPAVANKTGEVVTADFATYSANSSDLKTVTANCGNTLTAKVLVLQTGDFEVTSDPNVVSLAPGGTAKTTLKVVPLDGFAETVAMTVSGLPSGVSAAFSPTTLDPNAHEKSGSKLTFTATTSAVPGQYQVTVTGTSTLGSRVARITLNIANYSIEVSPSIVTVALGRTRDVAVTVKANTGYAGSVNLAALPLPQGVTGTFTPSSVNLTSGSTATSKLSLTALATAETETSTVAVTGTDASGFKATSDIKLSISDFSLAALDEGESVSLSVGGTVEQPINLVPINSYSDTVTLTAAVKKSDNTAATGFTVAFAPNKLSEQLGLTSIATITAASNVAPGQYNLIVTGKDTGNVLTRTVTIPINICKYGIGVRADPLVIPVGQTKTTTVEVNGDTGFNSSVALSATGMPTGMIATFTPATVTGNATSTLSVAVGATVPVGEYPLLIKGASTAAGSYTTELVVKVADFALRADEEVVSAVPGQTGTAHINLIPLMGFNDTVKLTAVGPTGVTFGFSPLNVTPQAPASTLTVTVASSVLPGVYPITIKGTDQMPGLKPVHEITLNLSVSKLSVIATPATANVLVGKNLAILSTVTPNLGYSGTVTMTTEYEASGVTITPVTSSIPVVAGTPKNHTFIVTATANAVPGSYPVTIKATDTAGNYATALVTLNVLDFALENDPYDVILNAGSQATAEIAVVPVGPFEGTVAISVSGGIAGLTGTIAPTSAKVDKPSILTVTATAAVVAGDYTFTITGTSGGVARTKQVPVTVTSARTWTKGAVLQGGEIITPANNKVVSPGSRVDLLAADVIDKDHWTAAGGAFGDEEDIVRYTWTTPDGGYFAGDMADGNPSITWVAPRTPGTYTIYCTVDDAPALISATDTGTRDDTALPARSITIIVGQNSSQLTWTIGTPISAGSIIYPANDGTIPTSTKAQFAVEPVKDLDHWQMYNGSGVVVDEGDEHDTLTHSWTCSAGNFITGYDEDEHPIYGTTSSQMNPIWIAPATVPVGGTVTFTYNVNDTPITVVAPDTGTRDDVARTQQSVTITIVDTSEQSIAKLQYSTDGKVVEDSTKTWNDVPLTGQTGYPLEVNQNDIVMFKAIKSRLDLEWPAGTPLWGGEAQIHEEGEEASRLQARHSTGHGAEQVIGDYVSVPFLEPSTVAVPIRSVTASSGNTLQADVRVNGGHLLTVKSSKQEVLAGGNTNISQTSITIKLTDLLGNSISGKILNIASFFVDKEGELTSIQAGHLSKSVVTTDSNGDASVTLTADIIPSEIGYASILITPDASNPLLNLKYSPTLIKFSTPDVNDAPGPWTENENGGVESEVLITVEYQGDRLVNRPFSLRVIGIYKLENENTVRVDGGNPTAWATFDRPSDITDAQGQMKPKLRWEHDVEDPASYRIEYEMDDVRTLSER